MAQRSRCLWPAQDALQPLETVKRQGHLRQDDGRFGRRTRRREDCDDRRNQLEGAPHCDQFGRQKGRRGRLIGRTKGGMNTKLHAICDSRGRPLSLFFTAAKAATSLYKAAMGSGGFFAPATGRSCAKHECVKQPLGTAPLPRVAEQ